jgi:SAM-dependent methyltransferase
MSSSRQTEFDAYAANYDSALAQGLSVSGEDKEYFASGRIAWLARRLHEIGESPSNVMDYGCGTGSATPYLFDTLKAKTMVGVDSSVESLKHATAQHGSANARFLSFSEYSPSANLDLVFCNGVFHHIAPVERAMAVDYIYRCLRPGGLFAFWENNPWNPGTRIVMSRIPFDRDAITLSVIEARNMLKQSGFQIVRTDFMFIFPKALSGLRKVEPMLSRFPLGAQYEVLCRKP